MSEDRIASFWLVARSRANLAFMPGYFGPSALESVQPPAWSFGNTDEGKRLLSDLLAHGMCTTTVPLAEFEETGESIPEVGTLGIVLDAEDEPTALVATTEVTTSGTDVVEVLRVLYDAAD